MKQTTQHPPRRSRHLRVPVLPSEEAQIKHCASLHGLPVAAFLRNLGLNRRVRGMLDHKRVEELAATHAELERLARLLQRCMTSDVRVAAIDAPVLRDVLEKLARLQDQVHGIMRSVVQAASAAA